MKTGQPADDVTVLSKYFDRDYHAVMADEECAISHETPPEDKDELELRAAEIARERSFEFPADIEESCSRGGSTTAARTACPPDRTGDAKRRTAAGQGGGRSGAGALFLYDHAPVGYCHAR